MQVIVFHNGFACRGTVREWMSSEGYAFWRDVRDGYIPETLKTDFPDGVRLHVVDHTSTKAQPPAVLVPNGGDSPMRVKVRSQHGASVVACHPHDAPGAVVAWLMREGTIGRDKQRPRPRRLRGPMGTVVDEKVSFEEQGLTGSVVLDWD
ncbi:hypothetical protein GGF31_007032 [Allomyces arbusculus]|nr:hypothetical protein GGF31_007032 [Allomyces arbusculus]